MPIFITLREFAKLNGVPVSTVSFWVNHGKIAEKNIARIQKRVVGIIKSTELPKLKLGRPFRKEIADVKKGTNT